MRVRVAEREAACHDIHTWYIFRESAAALNTRWLDDDVGLLWLLCRDEYGAAGSSSEYTISQVIPAENLFPVNGSDPNYIYHR